MITLPSSALIWNIAFQKSSYRAVSDEEEYGEYRGLIDSHSLQDIEDHMGMRDTGY